MVRTGADRLLNEPAVTRLIAGRAWALVCHQASVDGRARHLFDVVCADPVLRPRTLYVPEHGLFAEHLYMEPVPDAVDPRLGVPVRSLYGADARSLAPEPDELRGLDVVVFDLQDVGARYYTYLATMAMTMAACARAGVPFVVLDRPNPIGGVAVEGNLPDPALRSFVSYLPLANRHGMTAGEVAALARDALGLDLELTVIPCRGWRRDRVWPATGLPFVPPSPNIPTWETALVYPGMCLLEGTNLSEGRGTTTPFFLFGAPWIRDPWALCDALNREAPEGAAFRPTAFVPSHDKGAGARCLGAQLLVTDPGRFRPLATGLAVLAAVRRLHPEDLALRTDAYEFVSDIPALDLLLGSADLRRALFDGTPAAELAAALDAPARAFADERRRYLLYP
jgi:uncharacterized protein YbbC (DUF1343 family)